jgi:hypothetical protein
MDRDRTHDFSIRREQARPIATCGWFLEIGTRRRYCQELSVAHDFVCDTYEELGDLPAEIGSSTAFLLKNFLESNFELAHSGANEPTLVFVGGLTNSAEPSPPRRARGVRTSIQNGYE